MAFVIGLSLFFVVIILVISFILERRISRLKLVIEQERSIGQRNAQDLAQKLFNQWTETSVSSMRSQIAETLKKDYQVQLESWKLAEEKRIREDAIQKSINTLLGKIGEEFSPVLLSTKFGVNLKDFRHLGTPVDFVAFKGLSDNSNDLEIIFLEIKSGKSSGLMERERKVRDAVAAKRVRYEIVNLNDVIGDIKNKMNISDQS